MIVIETARTTFCLSRFLFR